MARTSNIYVRVEPDIKEQAEVVLEKLGIPMSNAVSIFLRQVIMQNGLPFEVKIPNVKPLSLPDLSEAEFNMEIRKAHNDFENGRTYSFEEVENELKRELGR
ncbi:type II toxin-antitoxin system RelB/DinJ family antitoxin [Clostridiales bacterium COT073_COT-073]|nr:type II toxin-antitoxin system RelB/DinJ family antitoxin [Clostridiales bacterium COT073_COT-073]